MEQDAFDPFADGAFEKKEKLGAGGNGEVFVANCGEHRYAMKEYALKVVTVPLDSSENPCPGKLWREAEILDSFYNRNIVKCIDARFTEDFSQFRIFMEIARYGDLSSFVKKRGYLHRKTARMFFNQIASGLRVIHFEGYAHRDIKPSNILVFGLRDVQIADFGQAATTYRYDKVLRFGGTPYFRPPESQTGSDYYVDGVHWDLWGASMVLIYCILGKYPWKHSSFGDPEYAAFQRGDFQWLVRTDRRWMRAKSDFWYLRRLLRHDPVMRIVPFAYSM